MKQDIINTNPASLMSVEKDQIKITYINNSNTVNFVESYNTLLY